MTLLYLPVVAFYATRDGEHALFPGSHDQAYVDRLCDSVVGFCYSHRRVKGRGDPIPFMMRGIGWIMTAPRVKGLF
jgi:hypothetical protein